MPLSPRLTGLLCSAFSDGYGYVGQKSHAGRLPRASGILNSVLRHLPLQSASRSRSPHAARCLQTRRRAALSGSFQEIDSDDSCTHIYSSICESSSGEKRGARAKKGRSGFSKSLRSFLSRSK